MGQEVEKVAEGEDDAVNSQAGQSENFTTDEEDER